MSCCACLMSSSEGDCPGLRRVLSRCSISRRRNVSTDSNNSCPDCSEMTWPRIAPRERTSRRRGLSFAAGADGAMSPARRACWSSTFHRALDLFGIERECRTEYMTERSCDKETGTPEGSSIWALRSDSRYHGAFSDTQGGGDRVQSFRASGGCRHRWSAG